MFRHIQIETNYAMNGSSIKIEELVKEAVNQNYSSLAITDSKMYGVIDFYKTCKKHHIKPVIGHKIVLEGLFSEQSNNILLYAKNNQGYQNLLKLSSIYATQNYIPFSKLQKYNNGLIMIYKTDESELLSLFKNNQINEKNELLTKLKDITKECYFSISKEKKINKELSKFQQIIVSDIRYLKQEDKEIFATLSKIFDRPKVSFSKELRAFNEESNLQPKINAYKKAANNTETLLESCNITLNFNQTLLPNYPTKTDASSKDYLSALAHKGLEKRLEGKKGNKEPYYERLTYELSVIDEMGYNDYFLIVWDFVKYAKKSGVLVGPGRGSAAASLVSYCLGITSVDSLKYDLVFERFLNPERISMPDIDMDFPDDKRDDVIKYVRDLYGLDQVASICTFGTFKKKSALRDTARILESNDVILKQFLKFSDPYETLKIAWEKSVDIQKITSNNKAAQKLFKIAMRIENLKRHVSTHAAGIIVSGEKLTNYTALQPGLLDMMQTQYEAEDLELLGLLKIDFLGLRNLTAIKNIASLIEENEKKTIDIYKIPLDDKKTLKLLENVQVTGIFQLESAGMRQLLRRLKINSFEDIVTCLALYRPGPMESIPSFLKRRFKKEKINYPHPTLKPILKQTNGIIIYQEQIIKIASSFAGYSLGEADLLRRAVSKKKLDVLENERKNFIKKSKQLNRDSKISNEIYDYIVKFANYGFNKAHSVSYAMVSYWLAYLKANYPSYFISILTTSVIGSEKKVKEYMFEANRLNVYIKPPSVNRSTLIFEPIKNILIYPFIGIKYLGRNSAEKIVDERHKGLYKNAFDFISRTKSFLNKRIYTNLIYAGAFDEFEYSKKTLIENLDKMINWVDYGSFIEQDNLDITPSGNYTLKDLQDLEIKALGFNFFIDPLKDYKKYIKKNQLLTPSDIDESHISSVIRLVGILSRTKEISTKNNQQMAFMTFQDQNSTLDSVSFPKTYKQYYDIITLGEIFLIKGKIDKRNNSLQLIIDKLHRLS
ncbi:MAG: DNA polymerase III subunit alpha [Candidatus Izimaplasma sp.]|nr:DNA polymerase III subunit alpha [Candidatus Izimaplasma bacterium]